jgi:hypothetical protein
MTAAIVDRGGFSFHAPVVKGRCMVMDRGDIPADPANSQSIRKAWKRLLDLCAQRVAERLRKESQPNDVPRVASGLEFRNAKDRV